jgi:O-antigen ligase
MLNYKTTQRVLLIILEGLIYLSFLMPFVFLNGSIFPFIVGKILYFQAVAQLMVAVYLLLLVVNFRQFKPKKNLLLYWLYFYAATLFLSAVFGIDFERSFFSNFERMTGVFVVFHFITYSIIVSAVFNTWPKIKRAIQVLLGVSLMQAFVVLEQYIKPGVFLYANKGGRVWGTLGNSIYIGSYFLFHIFFAAYLAVKEKKQAWQIIYLSIALLEAYIIIHSGSSRGATLAFILSAVFIIFAYAFLAKNKKIRRAALVVVLGAVMAISGIFIFQNTGLVKSIPLSDKIIGVPASLKEGTGRTRLIAWEIAWKAFKERPVLGWGLENFYYAFNKYYNPESLRYSYYETWFDRSHSVIFDTLSSGGAVGTISYFGLFAVGGYLLIAAWRKGLADKHALIFFMAIFSTYLIQILFVFDHPASYFLIYFSFGLLLSLISAKSEEIEPKYGFTNSSFIAIAGVAAVAFLILFFSTSIRTYKAATGIIEAESTFVQNYKMGLQSYKDILQMNTPFIDDMRSTMAKRIASVGPAQLGSLPEYKDALLFARGELLKQTNKDGIDVYDYIILGQLDTLLAQYDQNYLKSAEDFFAKARELSPKRQQIFYTWAKTKIMMGDYQGAETLLKDALDFEPLVPDSYWYLALLYEQAGKSDLAWPFVMEAIDKRYTWKSPEEINFALSLGEKLKKDNDLVSVYNIAIGAAPGAGLYAGLGNVYMRLGKKDEAYGAFMQAEKLNPDIFKKK